MACQKTCKQGRDDIIVKVNLQLMPIVFFFFFLPIVSNCNVQRCRDRALEITFPPVTTATFPERSIVG